MELALYPLIYRIAWIINANQIQVSCQLDLTFIEFEIHEISIEVFFESARHKNRYPHFIRVPIGADRSRQWTF